MATTVTNDFKQIQQLAVNGGGWLTKKHMCSNGSLLTGGDTYGVWRIKTGETSHELLLSFSNVIDAAAATEPANTTDLGGCYAVGACDANPQAIAFVWKSLVYYRQSDAADFTALNFTVPAQGASNPNANGAKEGQRKLAIDPVNQEVIYVGWDYSATGAQGLWRLMGVSNAATQTTLPLPLTGYNIGVGAIFIDPNSSNVGSGTTLRKSRVVTSVAGRGVYYSLDGGDTWTGPVAGSPLQPMTDAAIDSNGVIWMVAQNATVYKFSAANVLTNVSGSISGVSNNGGTLGLAVQGTRIIIYDYVGLSSQSTDGGTTFTAMARTYTMVAGDTPWASTVTTIPNYLSSTWVCFDAAVTGKLWGIGGQTVWYATPPTTNYATTNYNITPLCKGINQAVGQGFASKADGTLIEHMWDVGGFDITKSIVTPSVRRFPSNDSSILDITAVDVLERDNNVMAFTVARITGGATVSKKSLDGGVTWSSFPTVPAFGAIAGGEIRALSSTNFIWVPRQQQPQYTLDGGTTWNAVVLPGINAVGGASPSYGELNQSNGGFQLKRQILAIDPVTAGKAWIYHWGAGTFVTTNGGVSWTLASATTFSLSNFHAHMKPMWDRTNTLFITRGTINPVDNPATGEFAYSTNGATSWTTHPDIKAVSDFDFGAKLNNQAYPSIYFYGCVNGNTVGHNGFGLYASDDNLASVRKLSNGAIADSFDWACAIGASRRHRDLVAIGFNGSTGAICFPSEVGKIPIFHE